MSVVRAALLLIVLVGLVGLGLQNLSPAVPLVFLGLRSQPLPLAFWVVGAVAAGIITGLVILGLLNLSNYLGQRKLRSRLQQEPPPKAPSTSGRYRQDNKPEPRDYSSSAKGYEAEPGPRTGYKSGSSYSYSYKDPTQSGVGRRESVFDAEYREVTPPTNRAADPEDDDDWFEDGDENDFDWQEDSPTDTRR